MMDCRGAGIQISIAESEGAGTGAAAHRIIR
jgi:hypothetical protein